VVRRGRFGPGADLPLFESAIEGCAVVRVVVEAKKETRELITESMK